MDGEADNSTQGTADTQIAVAACALCLSTKPVTEFHKKGARRDNRCKPCVSKAKAARYKVKKRKKKTISEDTQFQSRLNGSPSLSAVEEFASIFVFSVKELFDEGKE